MRAYSIRCNKPFEMNESRFSRLLLIRLFQLPTSSSVGGCHVRAFLELSGCFRPSFPVKSLARNIWQLAGGPMVSVAPGVDTAVLTHWANKDAGSVRRAGIRSPLQREQSFTTAGSR